MLNPLAQGEEVANLLDRLLFIHNILTLLFWFIYYLLLDLDGINDSWGNAILLVLDSCFFRWVSITAVDWNFFISHHMILCVHSLTFFNCLSNLFFVIMLIEEFIDTLTLVHFVLLLKLSKSNILDNRIIFDIEREWPLNHRVDIIWFFVSWNFIFLVIFNN